MPSLSFFIDDNDANLLLDRLNADPEIAFIVRDDRSETNKCDPRRGLAFSADGGELKAEVEPPRRWRAVRTVNALKEGLQSLWHIPAGSLPLIEIKRDSDAMRVMSLMGPNSPPLYPSIPDPWSGWTGSDQFGPGCAPWIRLELWTRHRPYSEQERATLREFISFWTEKDDMIVVSDLQWTGSHFRPAPPETQRWWNRMKGWIDRTAFRLPTQAGFSVWAFPSALKKLKGGMRYYARNFDLKAGIERAETRDNNR